MKKYKKSYADFVFNAFSAQPRIGLLRFVALEMTVDCSVHDLAAQIAPLEQFASLGSCK